MRPGCGACETMLVLVCASPVTCSLRNRNWSPVPLMSLPAAVTVRLAPEACSLPWAGWLMSWQVKPDGQFGSGGGGAGAVPWPNAYSCPAIVPT